LTAEIWDRGCPHPPRDRRRPRRRFAACFNGAAGVPTRPGSAGALAGDLRRASMGPRFLDRGNLGAPAPSPAICGVLQRGRGSLTAEIWDRRRPRRRFAACFNGAAVH